MHASPSVLHHSHTAQSNLYTIASVFSFCTDRTMQHVFIFWLSNYIGGLFMPCI